MIAPLLQAIRDELRINLAPLNIPEDDIQVTKNEKVNADIAQVGVSIYAVDISPSDPSGNAILVVDLAVAVGVTLKARYVPVDRRGEYLVTDIGNSSNISLDEVIQRIIRSIHGQPKIIQAASRLALKLGLSYCEPLYLSRSISTAEDKGPDHFNIPDDQSTTVSYNDDDLEALYQEVVFQGAKCFQPALDFESTVS